VISRVPRNIEIKAHLTDPAAVQEIAERLCGPTAAVLRQIDTYFPCVHGRLKLREIEGFAAELIWYDRPDDAQAKGSDYLIASVADAAMIRQTLARALGIRGVVAKTRRLYLYQNVRIHLDDVDSAGSFLEFEAVLTDQIDDFAGRRQIDDLRREFGIAAADLLAGSYGDMLATPEA
jgi:predicted adenylyl cyclase CyaB